MELSWHPTAQPPPLLTCPPQAAHLLLLVNLHCCPMGVEWNHGGTKAREAREDLIPDCSFNLSVPPRALGWLPFRHTGLPSLPEWPGVPSELAPQSPVCPLTQAREQLTWASAELCAVLVQNHTGSYPPGGPVRWSLYSSFRWGGRPSTSAWRAAQLASWGQLPAPGTHPWLWCCLMAPFHFPSDKTLWELGLHCSFFCHLSVSDGLSSLVLILAGRFLSSTLLPSLPSPWVKSLPHPLSPWSLCSFHFEVISECREAASCCRRFVIQEVGQDHRSGQNELTQSQERPVGTLTSRLGAGALEWGCFLY